MSSTILEIENESLRRELSLLKEKIKSCLILMREKDSVIADLEAEIRNMQLYTKRIEDDRDKLLEKLNHLSKCIELNQPTAGRRYE